ncbi:MAG: DUF4253 domain-containing protein, partial [Fusobacterium periodonticum]|nr:DUF4253 domain-containing protein [Fusobacterium periodonticum]
FEEASEKYLATYKDGKEKGYTPVFLTVDEYLLKTFEISMKDENTDNMIDIFNKNLEKAKNINPIELFNKFIEQSMDKYFTEDDYKFDDSNKNNLKFLTIFNNEGNLKDNVILVKVPSTKPYEILAYFGMGSEGIATVKYWYEKYGAVPAAITYDEIEFYVERPVQTFEEARKLAIEQYAFCYGLLWECYDTLDELASAIYKNVQWYFWWS